MTCSKCSGRRRSADLHRMTNTSSTDASERLLRSRDRWRLLAIGLACTAAGFAAGGMQGAPRRAPLVAAVVDTSRPSGRWNSTLLGLDETGKVYALNTTKPQSVWEVFTYSP